MTSSLLECYFLLVVGRLPAAELHLLATPADLADLGRLCCR
jgi:hypothetical protein